MRSFFATVARAFASSARRRWPSSSSSSTTRRATCDCRDMIAAVPEAPSMAHLRGVVEARFDAAVAATQSGGDGGDAEAGAVVTTARREEAVRRTVFELRYCCGGAGRCTCAGAPACRYPRCVAWRPRGAAVAVYATRRAHEGDAATLATPAMAALVRLAQDERLDEAAEGIRCLAGDELAAAACGRPLVPALRGDDDEGDRVLAADDEVNPLRATTAAAEALRERVVALYLWRAALLVNARRGAAAVDSLLNLADALAPASPHRARVAHAAASWAALNDAEVIYYRNVAQRYAAWPHATAMATCRPMLLPRVVEAARCDAARLRGCARVVLATEVAALAARMQDAAAAAAQDNTGGERDDSEDVLRGLCVPLALAYYRFGLGDDFWHAFCALRCAPSSPPPTRTATAAAAEGGGGDDGAGEQDAAAAPSTPSSMDLVTDAVGRSMLLHHLLRYADAREAEIASGAVAARVAALRRNGRAVAAVDYDRVLDAAGAATAKARLQRLLLYARRASTTSGGAAAASMVSRDDAAAPLPRA